MLEKVTDSVEQTTDAVSEILAGRSQKGRLARLLPFLGPAFIASVAYIDPGNFATNIRREPPTASLAWVIVPAA